MLRKIFLFLFAPIRYAVRHEIERAMPRIVLDKDIRVARQRRALETTVEYVESNMSSVDSVDSNLALLTKALELADFAPTKLVCEFGVSSGVTINHIAAQMGTTVYGFDSFEGLPERWRDGYDKGRFKVSRVPEVRCNVELVKGWFDQSLPVFLRNHQGNVSFLHIDCDLYSSTKTVLGLLKGRIKPGCVIVFDEYFNYPEWQEGEWKALHEFIAETGLGYEYVGYNRLYESVAVKITAG
jgi:hypothetical protein